MGGGGEGGGGDAGVWGGDLTDRSLHVVLHEYTVLSEDVVLAFVAWYMLRERNMCLKTTICQL